MQTIGHNRALMKQITANRLIAHIAHHALSPLKKTQKKPCSLQTAHSMVIYFRYKYVN